jgi:hypothetical protein
MRLASLALTITAGFAFSQQPGRFADAKTCSICHDRIAPPATVAGPVPAAIAPFALWQGTMMAHSARDPYWKAKVWYESFETPAAIEAIQDTCLRCHAPQQQYGLRSTGALLRMDDLLPIGNEGVGCTVCHQIIADRLGTRDSFDAEFTINLWRDIYGPHRSPNGQPMISRSGYKPVEAKHILDSALCATCHTVITPILDADGSPHGEFVEQAPYIEWLAGNHALQGRSCQSCHMPSIKDPTGNEVPQFIAHQPSGGIFPFLQPRHPFALHSFAGGNVPMLRLLTALFPADKAALDRTLQLTSRSMAGALRLEGAAVVQGDRIQIAVRVVNQTGHKLPTAFPSRRIWLHVLVQDSAGAVVFQSGSPGKDFGPQPHWTSIERPEQVMIYENETIDRHGNPTVSLLRAAGHWKDNRILPQGFDLSRPLPSGIHARDIAPVGVDGDADFLPGSDLITYFTPAAGNGHYSITVEAFYQSVKPSHAAAMRPYNSPEEALFTQWAAISGAAFRVAESKLTIDLQPASQ